MTLIVCPDRPPFPCTDPIVFMAGGITGCPDWQSDFADYARDLDALLLNPRRALFDYNDPTLKAAQIEWEFENLEAADLVTFWFPAEADCISTMHELGDVACRERLAERSGRPERRLLVGCHPEYSRAYDVHKQLELKTPWITVVDNLFDLYAQLHDELG